MSYKWGHFEGTNHWWLKENLYLPRPCNHFHISKILKYRKWAIHFLYFVHYSSTSSVKSNSTTTKKAMAPSLEWPYQDNIRSRNYIKQFKNGKGVKQSLQTKKKDMIQTNIIWRLIYRFTAYIQEWLFKNHSEQNILHW